MSSNINMYQNVLNSHQNFSSLSENNPQFRQAQKALFSSISALYPTLGLSPVEALSRDVFYQQAKLICQGVTFQNHPGSLNRLTPFATNYCLTFNEIISSLRNPPQQPIDLKEKFEHLGNCHLRFANAYVPELMKAAPETSTVISLKYPQTLKHFLDVALPHIQELKTEIEDADGKFLTLTLPCLAIEKLLSDPADLPEFFQPYQSTFLKKSKSWADLSNDEKTNLHKKILGQDIGISPVTEQLYSSIRLIATEIHRDLAQRKELTLISRETCKNLQMRLCPHRA